MKLSHYLAAAALSIATAVSHAAVVNVASNGSWNNYANSSVRNFTITAPGEYLFRFALTPRDASQPNLATLVSLAWNFSSANPLDILRVTDSIANVGANGYSNSFRFRADRAGQFGFDLNFTNFGAWNGQLSTNLAPVPEPETYALMGIGLATLLLSRRRKKQ